MTDARHALLSAIYDLLTADPELDGSLAEGKVYDHAPRGAAFPFIAFGDVVSRPLDGDLTETTEHNAEVFVHSRAAGRGEASAIAERVRELLLDTAPALEGHRLVSVRHRDTSVGATRDRRAYRARLRFRLLTEPN